MKKLAILGASYLQRPLVEKAKEIGLETHVFAWEEGNVVDDIADYYYPISVLEKEEIFNECMSIGIDGITSIASDIVMPAVNYVAKKLGLIGNSLEATKISTDKFAMRKALKEADIPCPKFALYNRPNYQDKGELEFPVIIKPTDRSGSRGITKVGTPRKVNAGIRHALSNSIKGSVIVEEFIEGRELSVEMISYRGEHHFLSITDKVTTGEPYFVEMEHYQPASIDNGIKVRIIDVVQYALDALGIKNGASHSEILVTPNGDIEIVEIAGRMGGDFIGSHLVYHTTGFDYMKAVIEIALGDFEMQDYKFYKDKKAGVYFLTAKSGIVEKIKNIEDQFENVLLAMPLVQKGDEVESLLDSSTKRSGVVVYKNADKNQEFNPASVLQIKTSVN